MLPIDYALLAVVGLSALAGFFRGFFKEAFSLLGWVIAIWGAWSFGEQAAAMMPAFVADQNVMVWVGRLAILIGVLLITGILSRIASMVMGKTGLDGTDRVVGIIFGLARGVVLAGLVVNLIQVAGFEGNPWWQESKLIPYAAPIAKSLRDIADDGVEKLYEEAGQLEVPSLGQEE